MIMVTNYHKWHFMFFLCITFLTKLRKMAKGAWREKPLLLMVHFSSKVYKETTKRSKNILLIHDARNERVCLQIWTRNFTPTGKNWRWLLTASVHALKSMETIWQIPTFCIEILFIAKKFFKRGFYKKVYGLFKLETVTKGFHKLYQN